MQRHLTTGPILIAALMQAHRTMSDETEDSPPSAPIPPWHDLAALLRRHVARAADTMDS